MSRVTLYGYFGPTTNVKDAPISGAGLDAFAAMIAALPPRSQAADTVPLPIARDPAGRPLRFISVTHLQPGD